MFSNNLNYRRHIFNQLYIFNNNKSVHSRCRAINRIGPHNQEVISIIFGLLLGDGFTMNRSGEGVRITIK
jgi:hypothetical protein